MINTINRLIISFNAYAYYFVSSFWLKGGHHSEEYKIGSGLTILLISNFSWMYFIFHQVEFNWKATLFFFCCYHILVQMIFHEKILNFVNKAKARKLDKGYMLFILYLIIGCILLFINIFYY